MAFLCSAAIHETVGRLRFRWRLGGPFTCHPPQLFSSFSAGGGGHPSSSYPRNVPGGPLGAIRPHHPSALPGTDVIDKPSGRAKRMVSRSKRALRDVQSAHATNAEAQRSSNPCLTLTWALDCTICISRPLGGRSDWQGVLGESWYYTKVVHLRIEREELLKIAPVKDVNVKFEFPKHAELISQSAVVPKPFNYTTFFSIIECQPLRGIQSQARALPSRTLQSLRLSASSCPLSPSHPRCQRHCSSSPHTARGRSDMAHHHYP